MKRFVSLAMVIVVCGFSAAHVTGQNLDRIFFSTFSPQGWDVFISLDQGETVRKLTDHPSLDYGAVVSPDNRWVVFTSERSGMAQLYAISLDNTDAEPIRLFNTGSFQDQATFSPDGKWVIYTTEGYGINDEQPLIQGLIFSPQMYGEIIAYHVDTKERVRLTHNKWEDGTPLWVRSVISD